MNRKNTRVSAILGIILSSLQIVAVLFLCCMLVAYGMFLKGTPKGDENVLLKVFEVIGFYTFLITFVFIGFLGFMISYGLKIYRTHNLPPLDYKNKDALFKIYTIINVFIYIVITVILLLLCFAGAFNSALVSVIIVFLAICFILMFLHSYLINIDIFANNKLVKRDSVTNIKEGNFNQKYGLGEYANKKPTQTNDTNNNKL